VISGWSLGFLLFSIGFFTSGFWLYTHQPPPPVPQSSPYYVNHVVTAVRPCLQCVAADGKLKLSREWKLGKPIDVPSGEQWWFAPVEQALNPVKIDGIPMLAVHPATDKDKPWYGFDQRRVLLAVLQDLDPKYSIDHPAPLPTIPAQPSATPATPDPAISGSSPPTSTAPQQ
jgi:hypothetical protein